jgi:hypothetical protein
MTIGSDLDTKLAAQDSAITSMGQKSASADAATGALTQRVAALESDKTLAAAVAALTARVSTLEMKAAAPTPTPAPTPAPVVVAPTPVVTPTPTPVVTPTPAPTPVATAPSTQSLVAVQALIDQSWAGLPATWLKPALPAAGTLPIRTQTTPVSSEGSPLGKGLVDKWFDGCTISNQTASALLLDGSQRVLLTNCTLSADAYSVWANVISDIVCINCTFSEIKGTQDQSTFRLVSAARVFIYGCTFTNMARHCVRFHGGASDIHILNSTLNGGGTMMMNSPPEDTGLQRLRIQNTNINSLQADEVNLSTSLCTDVRLINVTSTRRVPNTYSGLLGYISSHPASWTVTGCSVIGGTP